MVNKSETRNRHRVRCWRGMFCRFENIHSTLTDEVLSDTIQYLYYLFATSLSTSSFIFSPFALSPTHVYAISLVNRPSHDAASSLQQVTWLRIKIVFGALHHACSAAIAACNALQRYSRESPPVGFRRGWCNVSDDLLEGEPLIQLQAHASYSIANNVMICRNHGRCCE